MFCCEHTFMDRTRGVCRHASIHALAILLLCAPPDTQADTHRLPLLPSASDELREGFVRIINHSDAAGRVAVTAIDDSGRSFGPVTLAMARGQAIGFSSTDLEQGNDALGIASGIGSGYGDWRLVLDTTLDIEPLAYVRTPAGFIDSLHDVVPRRPFYHRVTLLAPDSFLPDGSAVRLINSTAEAADVVIFGVDDGNALASGHVSIGLPAGAARTVTARELENGAAGLQGRLGIGAGDWQLLVFTDAAIEAMTVLDASSGPLANLSAAQVDEGSILLFLAAGDPWREGRLRITNRSGAGQIRIRALDDAGRSFGPVTLTMEGARTVTLTSGDLEAGNAAMGLPRGLGRGTGDWRLVLESDLNLDVFGYVRSQDGVISSAHNVAVEGRRRHHVPFFNPASDHGQTSRLRLINPSDGEAQVLIRAWDDVGAAAPEGAVSLSVPAGASTSLSADALEVGGSGLNGRLGAGQGGWRLAVEADRDIRVMSLAEDTAGHLTNLSTSLVRPSFLDPCVGGPSDADGDGVSDHCDREPDTARTLAGCSDGSYVPGADESPGLVRDCEVLVGFANHQAQSGELSADHVLHNWGTGDQRIIGSWAGIEIRGGRVTAIRLSETQSEPGGLTGSIPPQFGELAGLRVLDLSGNELSGWIPWELGNLPFLQILNLSGNRLIGALAPEFANLAYLHELNLRSNRLTGTLPRRLWARAASRELMLSYRDNAILGFGPASSGSERPPDSEDAENNGNASHHSVAWYQGPLVWEWDWQGEPVQHQRPVLGRWAVLAVRVDHDFPTPPPVITRVLDSQGNVLSERLAEAAPANTISTGSDMWRTEYVFELPGSLYRAGNELVHVIDPYDELAETDENDNVGEPIALYGDRFTPFRATFIPLYFTGDDPPTIDAEALMTGVRAYLPIADDYEVQVALPRQSNAGSFDQLIDEVRAIWNAEADPDEYYHGVYLWPWLGGGTGLARTGGIAEVFGNVAVSAIAPSVVIPHEFGHNLGLRHPPGCSAGSVDTGYPYQNGELGPVAGWDVQWRRFVSNADESHTDLMSYCGQYEFVSAYQYRKAANFRLGRHLVTSASGGRPFARSALAAQRTGTPVGQSTSVPQQPAQGSDDVAGFGLSEPEQLVLEADAGGGLALSGRIDASGLWSLTQAQTTARGPRAPPPDGSFTLILLDEAGEELYREPLSVNSLSHGDEAGWAARTPVPTGTARQLAVVDSAGVEVLRQELPALEQGAATAGASCSDPSATAGQQGGRC